MVEPALIGVATAATKVLVQWVASRALDEVSLGWGFEDQLLKLKEKFEYIQAFLDDAGNSKHAQKSQLVNLWVEKVKDAAYLADDVMDEYAIEIFQREMEPKNLMKELGSFCTPSNILFHIGMAHKVKKIISLFEEIDKEAKRIGLSQVNVATTPETHSCYDDQLSQTRRHAAVDASEFIDRKDDREKLLDFICRPSNDEESLMSTVAITGMAGVGKTTLTRHLYDHERICANFADGNKIWICVSENFDINRLLNEMVESVSESESKLSNSDAIIRKLQQVLNGKKLLIVLDDVWNDNESLWGSLLRSSLGKIRTAPGSVILITTRSDNVAKAAGTVFKRKLEWLWDLPHFQSKILPSLLLSFNHLPSTSVKQCFAYCAVIPKGDCMSKSELIGLWLSQGYLHDGERYDRTMEEIGEENLKILLGTSLLECVSTRSGILGYRANEIVYDLAVHVCGIDLIKQTKKMEKRGCRHLVFNSIENKDTSDIPPEKALLKLLTLCVIGTYVPWNILNQTRYLRTLKLDRTGIIELPPTIAMLKHLRFLDLSFNDISTLPDSIGKLYQLQTLVLTDCPNMKKLPQVVYELVNLRRILTTAPMVAGKGLQQLTNLQRLPLLPLNDDEDGWTIDELGELHQLRDEIRIEGLECVKDKDTARKAGLGGKTDVTNLNLSWAKGRGETSEGNGDEDVLEGLEPHPNIISLEVQNFLGVRLPIWVSGMAVLTDGPKSNRMQLSMLTMVKLIDCTKCQTLPRLGHLPLLKCLILSGLYVEFIGTEFYGGDDLYVSGVVPFQSLTELDISRFNSLTTWMEPPKASFPSLTSLRIRDCRLLKSVPTFEFKSLAILELENLNSVVSLDDSGEGWSIDERGDVHGFNDKISLQRLERVKDKTTAKMIGLDQKVNVTKLSLSWGKEREETSGGNCDEDVLEGLEPHPNIASLEVQNFLGVRFPTWIKGMAVLTQGPRGFLTRFHHLTTVKLLNCSNCQTLPKLGQLPLLECLILSGLDVEFIGIEFYGGDDLDLLGAVSFQRLIELEISGFPRLTTWMKPPKASFPYLETLRIRDCKLLKPRPAFLKSMVNPKLQRLSSYEDGDSHERKEEFQKSASFTGLDLRVNVRRRLGKRRIRTIFSSGLR